MVEVEEIQNPVFSSSTYLITNPDDNRCWVIDPGDIAQVVEHLKGKSVVGAFITHTHYDHIYGILELLKLFPQCVVYTSVFGATALKSEKLNFSVYHDSPIRYEGPVQILKEGDSINLFEDVQMRVIETPGHCPSCLTYIVDNYIFTGDSYIPWAKVVTKLRYGNREQAQESIEKIKSLITPSTNICAGHWGVGTMILRKF